MSPARYLIICLSLFLFWLVLSGHYVPLIIGFGVFSCALVSYLAFRMDREDRFVFEIPFSFRFAGYLAWLVKEIFVANVNVARIILDPALPISPIMVPFRASQKSDLGRMIYANSITLTPGTITTGTDGKVFRIHALTWHDVDGREEDEMDRRVTAMDPRT